MEKSAQEAPRKTPQAGSDSTDVATRAAPETLNTGGVTKAYLEKARLLNDAVQEIGMGKYQWGLFIVAGFGWMADNLWPQITAIIVPQVFLEFRPARRGYLTLAQNVGLAVGASFWGLASDIVGRKWAFNLTLLMSGAFGTAAGGAPTFVGLAFLAALWSVGVGGNLPVDSAVFLEYLPGTHQYLLTVMSIWWAFGQLLASLVAWPLLANYSCQENDATCPESSNRGWRYFLFAMGGFTLLCWVLRFFVFHLYESPKFLMGKGKDAEAVKSIERLAIYNGKETTLSLEDLQSVDSNTEFTPPGEAKTSQAETVQYTSKRAAVMRNLERFRGQHIRALFAGRKLAINTSLIILIWFIIGLAFPLYNGFLPTILALRGANQGQSTSVTFRNYAIIAICGIPGALLAGLLVEIKGFGRKGAMSVSTLLTGVFLFAGTTANSSNSLLGWNCGYAITSNIMYGVLYAYTPEAFPTSHRGTGTGIAATANRIGGIIAPIITFYADLSTSVPVYVAGALFLVGGFIMLLLPLEVRGHTSV